MANRAEISRRETGRGKPGRWPASLRRVGGGRAKSSMRSLLSAGLRLLLLVVIVWSVTGPVDRSPLTVGAAGLPPAVGQAGAGAAQAAIFFPETGYLVSTSPIGQYFAARGGARTFGPPVSNEFTLQGERVQLFRDFVLKQHVTGAVSTVDLSAMQAVPFREIDGRTVPERDASLVAGAPDPSASDYGAQVQAFITANAPDTWDGNAVGFHQAFLGTVRFDEAFPAGTGERGLLPGFAREVWGLPVSQPQRDPAHPNLVLLRWERGSMVWDSLTNTVTAVPLGQAFRAVLTGEGLSPEQVAEVAATGSPYLAQAHGPLPSGLARPDALPETALADAFRQSSAVEAGAVASQMNPTPTIEGWYAPAATVTPTPFPYLTFTPTPYGYVGGNMTPTPTPFGYVAPAQNQPSGGLPGAIPPQPGAPGVPGVPGAPGAATGSDPCYGDEEITFSPEIPRVGNEVLIAVTSSRPHPYGRLAGTEKTTFVRERPGQKGYVWEWTIMLSYPGQHEYTFYVDSTIPCKKLELTIRQGLATRTPTPTKTATPYNWDNNNDNNNNDNNGNNNNNNDNGSNSRAPSINPANYVIAGQDVYNCNSFQSQSQAQSVLRYEPSDPNRLDAEDTVEDGIACTTYIYSAYPNDDDYTPVQRTYPTATRTATPVHTPTATSVPTPATFDPSFYLNKGDAFNCVDFASQANAQAVLRLGFQRGRGDENKLDISSAGSQTTPDGIACNTGTDAPEWGQWFYFPEPHDKTPVSR